jgi:thiamine biosynthesis lipoprotein
MSTRQATFNAIGTRWEIRILDELTTNDWSRLLARINGRIMAFDAAYSRFRSDSLVTRMSKQAGTYDLPRDGHALINFYEQLYQATDGKVTPLIGQVMADAGYDAEYSLHAKVLHIPPNWEDVILYSKHTITLSTPALLDFGAAGKGYLVDIISEVLTEAKLASYLINAGGDILQRSTTERALEVGLENPQDSSEVIGAASLLNASLCASAGSKRKWNEFHHIIDPVTLQSPTEVTAVWVIANDTMTADGIATALFFTDPATLQKFFNFSFAVLDKDMTLHHSKDFPVNFFAVDSK